MKKLLFLFAVVITLLASCNKKDSGETIEKNGNSINASSGRQRTLSESATVLGGSWIAKQYLDNLRKQKAVYAIPMPKTTLFGMSFIKDSLATGNTLLYGFSRHEVTYSWPIYWNENMAGFQYDPKQDIGDKPLGDFTVNIIDDTSLELAFTKTGKKELYQKADIEEELNKLFAGNYNDNASGNTVTFTTDGKIEGLPGFVQYYVQFDPDAEESVPFDGIFLYANTTDEAGTPFHFKINGKNLNLYHVDAKEVEKYVAYDYTIGTVAFELTKQ